MRVLFAISIVALVALLYTFLAIVRHVRRARRSRLDELRPGQSQNPPSASAAKSSPHRPSF